MGFLFLSGLFIVYYTNTIYYNTIWPPKMFPTENILLYVREQKTDMSISPPTFQSFSLFVKDFEDLIIPDYKLSLTAWQGVNCFIWLASINWNIANVRLSSPSSSCQIQHRTRDTFWWWKMRLSNFIPPLENIYSLMPNMELFRPRSRSRRGIIERKTNKVVS